MTTNNNPRFPMDAPDSANVWVAWARRNDTNPALIAFAQDNPSIFEISGMGRKLVILDAVLKITNDLNDKERTHEAPEPTTLPDDDTRGFADANRDWLNKNGHAEWLKEMAADVKGYRLPHKDDEPTFVDKLVAASKADAKDSKAQARRKAILDRETTRMAKRLRKRGVPVSTIHMMVVLD